MGFFFSRWQEVFFGTDPEQFFRCQNLLRDNRIPFKTKTSNRAFREAMNNLDGRSSALTRVRPLQSGSGDEYRILVDRRDAQAAEFLLRSNGSPR